MKKFEFNLSRVMVDKFFPHYRIKTKPHLIEILMEAARFVLIQNDSELQTPDDKAVGKIVIYIDKMSRLFFFTNNKYYSIALPFYIIEEENKIRISFKNQVDVTPLLISKVISVINCDEFKEQCSLGFITPICEGEEECDENFWVFLRELLLMDDGYIRYDFDQKNYDEAVENGEEHKHPLNHYDLFYSNNATFKIGLSDKITNDNFINLLNTKTECEYLTKPSTE